MAQNMTTLKQGTKHAPKAVDASMSPKGGSVDSDTTRGKVAKSHSLGGRCA